MTPARVAKPVKRAAPQTAANTAVSRIMSREVITVRSGTSLESVIELMLARGLSRMPVLDDRQRPLGIISKTDVVEESHDRDDLEELPRRDDQGRGFHLHRQGATVDEVMSPTVLSVRDTASVEQVAELMVSRHLHGLPVVDSRGELAGFVSTMDVLAWLAGLR